MDHAVLSGEIQSGVLYQVAGSQSVIYNGITYNTGQFFRGVPSVNAFIFSGSGTQLLTEVTELKGGAVEQVENEADYPVFPETTIFRGFALEYQLNTAEQIVHETTEVQGFALELIDYPFYSFEIMETRL